MQNQSAIITGASEFVSKLFREHLQTDMVYHTYEHSEMVARSARKIGKGMRLGEEGIEVVMLAAWLHDTGYTEVYRGHEEVSTRIASEFLGREGYPIEKTTLVLGCIRATKIPQQPHNLLEQIVADADLSSLGRKSFFESSSLLQSELEKVLGESYTEEEWSQKNLQLLGEHTFFTRYAQEAYGEQQAENMRLLYKRIRRMQAQTEKASADENKSTSHKGPYDEASEYDEPELLHKGLSDLKLEQSHLDHKAQIIMLSNTILMIAGMFSITLWANSRRNDLSIGIPLFILLSAATIALICSALAVRPLRAATNGWLATAMDNNVLPANNLLQDYLAEQKLIEGKYYYLRLSYTIFIYGLSLTLLSFGAVYFLTRFCMH
ncbi:MAG: HD domain-containing protein [Bacteroidota bacterium]|nr:HD domain-containing protein [Bacteroidota bacterium]